MQDVGAYCKRLTQRVPLVLVLLLYVALSLVSLRTLLLQPGAIGLMQDWWLLPHSDEPAFFLRSIFTAWSESGTGAPFIRSGMRIYKIIETATAMMLGMGGAALSKTLPIVNMGIAGVSSYVLLRLYVRRGLPALVGSLLFVFSPLVFNTTVLGISYFVFSYALLPLIIFTYLKSFHEKEPFVWIVTTAFAFAFVLDVVQILSLIILIPLFFQIIFSRPRRRHIVRSVRIAIGMCVLTIVFGIHYLLPAILDFTGTASYIDSATMVAVDLPESPTFLGAFGGGGGGWADAFSLSYTSTFNTMWFPAAHLVLIVFLVTSLLFSKYRSHAIVWGIVFLIGVLIFKGVHPPLGAVNEWLYKNSFLMSAFRKPLYASALTSIAISVLVAMMIAHISQRIPNRTVFSYIARSIRGITLLLIAFVLVVQMFPFVKSDFTKRLQTFSLHPDYEDVIRQWHSDPTDGRRLVLPVLRQVYYKQSRYGGMDIVALRARSPIEETYYFYSPLSRFLVSLLHTANPTDIEGVLCATGVRSVVVREDFTSVKTQPRFPTYDRITWTQDEIETSSLWKYLTPARRFADGKAAIYNVKDPCPLVHSSEGITLSTGTLNDYIDIADFLRSQKDKMGDVIFTAQQQATTNLETLLAATKRVTVVQNNVLDLTHLFLQDTQPIVIQNLTDDLLRGFSPLSLWWAKDWHYAAVVDPNAVAATGWQRGVAPFSIAREDSYELWIKYMKTSSGSSLAFSLDDEEIGEINTLDDTVQGLAWERIPLGTVAAGQHTMQVASQGGENLIVRMSLVPSSVIALAQQQADTLLARHNVVLSLNFDSRNPVEYKRVFGSAERIQTNSKIPITVPRDGKYSLHIRTTERGFVEGAFQNESDYLQVIYADQSVGQTFKLPSGVTSITSLRFKLESRNISPNTFATKPPQAPLVVSIFKLEEDGTKAKKLASTSVQPDAAPLNDRWIFLNVPLEVPIKEPDAKYLVELSSSAKDIGWAVASASNGFNNIEDYYGDGSLIVNDKIQPSDLVFFLFVTFHRASQNLSFTFNNANASVPIGKVGTNWYTFKEQELAAGEYTVEITARDPHVRIDQIVLQDAVQEPPVPVPPIAYRKKSATLYSIFPPSNGTPYLVTLGQQFNPGWDAQLVDVQSNARSSIPPQNRLVVNGYANGWWVTPPGGEYALDVLYKPQRVLNVALLISTAVFVLCIGTILWLRRQRITEQLKRVPGGPALVVVGIVLIVAVASYQLVTGWVHIATYDVVQGAKTIQDRK